MLLWSCACLSTATQAVDRFLRRAAVWALDVMHNPEEAAQALGARLEDVAETKQVRAARRLPRELTQCPPHVPREMQPAPGGSTHGPY